MPSALKKRNKMSAPTVPTPKTINVSGLNDSLEIVKREIPYEFVPAEDMETAMARLNRDPVLITAALNEVLEAQAQKQARESVGLSIRKSDALTFAAPYRNVPPFSAITDRKEQTAAIFAKLAKSPAMVAMLKELASSATGPDSGDAE